jgi:hypothetical protein
MPNEYLDMMQSLVDGQDTQFRAAADTALQYDPDQVATSRRVAGYLGVPAPVVEAAPQDAQRQARLKQLEEDTASAPALRRRYTDADFAKLASDDSFNLSAIERGIRQLWKPNDPAFKRAATATGKFLADGAKNLVVGGIVGLGAMELDLAALPLDALSGTVGQLLPEDQFGRIAADYRQRAQRARAAAAEFGNQQDYKDSTIGSGFMSGMQSAGQNLLMLPVGMEVATMKGAHAAGQLVAGLMGAGVGAQAYTEARERGMGRAGAATYAAPQAVFEYAFESIPASRLLTDITRHSNIGTLVARQIVPEVVGEQATTVLQDLNEWVRLNPDKTIKQFLEERPDAAVQTLVATLVGIGVQGGTVRAVQRAIGGVAEQEARAADAEGYAARMQELLQLAAGSKLRERDAESFAAFAQEAAQEAGFDGSVHVDAPVLAQALQAAGLSSEQFAQLSPEAARGLQQAAPTGGTVAIPVGDLAGRLVGTGLEQSLLPHLRVTEDALSQEEAKLVTQQAQQMLQQEATRLVQQAQDSVAVEASSEKVKQGLLDQLTAANRFTADVNSAYASLASAFYTATSQRLGITPEELYARYPLRIQAVVDAEQSLGQGHRTVQVDGQRYPDTNSRGQVLHPTFQGQINFWRAFRGSQVVDPDGRPLVVYHGTGDDFTEFSRSEAGKATRAAGTDQGFFFTDRPDLASRYAEMRGSEGSPNVLPVYLILKNPLRASAANMMEADRLLAQGVGEHDGAIVTVGEGERQQTVYLVKDSTQVKSSIGNVGQFDTSSRDILEQPAYHGSPHQFDKFSTEHIGSGEGAQAFGWGLYFAENKGIAEGYHRTLTRAHGSFAVRVNGRHQRGTPIRYAAEKIAETQDTVTREDLIAYFESQLAEDESRSSLANNPALKKALQRERQAALKTLREAESVEVEIDRPAGALYQVDIPDAVVARMLLWDRPLGEQPESVREALEKAGLYTPPGALEEAFADRYAQAVASLGGNADAVRKAVIDLSRMDRTDGPAWDAAWAVLLEENPRAEGFDLNEIHDSLRPQYFETRYDHNTGEHVTVPVAQTGEEFYRSLASAEGSDRAASELLDSLGIPGIKFLDAGSRPKNIVDQELFDLVQKHGAEQAVEMKMRSIYETPKKKEKIRASLLEQAQSYTHNLVVFNDQNVQITHKDGTPVTKQERDGLLGQNTPGDKVARYRKALLAGRQLEELSPEERAQYEALDSTDLGQGASTRGTFSPSSLTITLLEKADLSTFLHETGHFFLEALADMAAQPDAPPALAADLQTVLDWFGVKDAAAWQQMTLDQQRPHHEKFAESFEQYLFEGKAPSREMQGLFARFRAWLTNVYRSLQQFMASYNTQLTDEVRGVFDRLLATQDAIEDALATRGFTPLFEAIADSGMDMTQWEKYQATNREYVEQAMARLQSRSLRDLRWVVNARSRELKKISKDVADKRKAVEAEVREQVRQDPVYAVQRWLKTGVMADGTKTEGAKLSTAALREMYGDGPAAPWRYLATNMVTGELGLHPDVVAEMFGFTSGDEMVRKIVAAFPEESEVQGLTDQRMLERYGDLISPEGQARAADEAIHNEARARAVATELAALQGATSPTRKMTATARAFAERLVASRRVRDLKPGQHLAAETRAAKRAAAASKAGDTQTALTEKRNELLNFYAARETTTALEDVDKGVKYLRKVADSDTLDADYREQIETLLERFNLRAVSNKALDRQATLLEWIEHQRELGVEPNIPPELLDEARRKSYKDMTVEEFRGLVDTVKQIEHLGRLKHKLLTAKDEREFGAIAADITRGILEHAKDRSADTRTPNTVLGETLVKLKRFAAMHVKVATWARIMDGGKDGGPVWEYLVRAANAAGDKEIGMREQAARELAALVAPVLRLGPMGGAGVFIPAVGRSMNREARLAVALNTGNASNLQRLMGGEGWSQAQVDAITGTLTEAEWAFVQNVWDYFESFRPEIAAKERRVSGVEPKWLEASPRTVIAAGGQQVNLRGGYYPVKYDPRASERAEAHADAEVKRAQMKGAYTSATTRRSFTKDRAEEVNGRPLLYSLDGIYTGVNEVIHDLSWHEFLIDANRLVRNQSISGAMRQKYGPEAHQQFKSWLQDIAAGEQGAANESWLGWVRQGVSISGLGFNVMSAVIQPLGITQSIERVGAKWVGRGIAQFTASPTAAADMVADKSEFMRTRALTRLRELAEVRAQVRGRSKARQAIDAGAYFLMLRAQQVVDIPTWIGAYEKAVVEGGNDEERAVALADQAVIDSQGSGTAKDLAAIERGDQALKLFTTFYSFFNTALNAGVRATMTTESKAQLASKYMLLYVVPVVLGALLKDALTAGDSGDWDDPKKVAKTLIREELSYLFGLMVGVRELSGMAQTLTGTAQYSTDYAGPAGLRPFADAVKLAKQANQGEADDALRKAVINTAGELLRLPAAQINRSINGARALSEGKTHNPLALVTGYQEAGR